MRIRQTLVGALAGTAVALGAAAVPAQAAPTGGAATASQAAGGTAPACIKRPVDYTSQGFWVRLENTCPKTMRVQVLVTGAPNSPCMTMGKGDTGPWYSYGANGRYLRTVVC
ncbi:beta-Ig-H3/fasciclin [Streptomyces violaceusniger]|uniref:beta-Ig-H3/fasciclin n=1 Tax=Streptomyces violaceusniger TaxID=68280 RepID=UPI00341EBFE2